MVKAEKYLVWFLRQVWLLVLIVAGLVSIPVILYLFVKWVKGG